MNRFKQMVLDYWRDQKPKLYKELKKAGTLEKEAEQKASSMTEEVLELTDQLKEKEGGQAQSLAEEIVIANHLPM